MKITVTDGDRTKEHEFREGTPASEAIAALGFDFPMPCGGKGRCGKCGCLINGKQALACRTQLFSDCVIEIPKIEQAVLTAEKNVPGAEGTVVDIGTTTIAAALFKGGVPVRKLGMRNPQCAYGADIISRLSAANPAALTDVVRKTVDEIRLELGGGAAVITGNSAMLSIYAGLNVSEMGVYPFNMPSHFDCELDGAYLPPCPGAFVGADALCSLLWSKAAGKAETSVVIDLGTNGEIALVCGGRILLTSAAAGPAMEGGSISRGMAAADGAIYRVDGRGFGVIGGGKPRGICGSGLVDAIALMLDLGALDGFGTLDADFEIHDSGIFITQQDVRAFQLCKAAISAAVKLLTEKAGISASDVDRFYLSGALGENISVANAAKTGLLPRLPAERFTAVGNGALLGGAMLLNPENRIKLREIAARAELINPAAEAAFMEKYIAEMNFY